MNRSEQDLLLLQEIYRSARENLSTETWDYLRGGAETETTLKRNRQALDSLAFRPRVLRDVSEVDCTTELLGRRMRLPVFLAPIGSLQDLHPEGGAAAARGAGQFGTVTMLSSQSAPGLEATAAAADGNKIFQLYVRGDRNYVDDYIQRAITAGYFAVALTVDLDHYGRRERDLSKRYVTTARQGVRGEDHQARFSWDDVRRIRDTFDIPLILKGIATAEDAAYAVEQGIAGVYVSNHGGRQLDHGRGTIEILPEVAAAVEGRASVLIDGGFLRGTDVVKAMALGADAVGVGKLFGYAIAAAGEHGVVRMLEILELEIITAMGLLGVTGWESLDPAFVCPATPMAPADAASAFPLLQEGY